MFDQSNNTSAIDVKMDGFVLKEKSVFKDAWIDVTNWIKAHTLSLLLKLQNWSLDLFYEVSFC